MTYQSRKRNLKTRREKLAHHTRNIRIILFFGCLALLLMLVFAGPRLWRWLGTYFY